MGVTKTDFMRGMQCPRMLWLDKHHPELKVIPPEVQARLDAGNEFGDKAMGMFGSFVEMTTYKADGKLDYKAMLQKTKECIEEKVPVICEAALMFYGNYCAQDILRKNGAGWDIYEVKNSSSVEEQFVKDISFQKYIAYKCGLKIIDCYIVYHGSNEESPFEIEKVTDKVRQNYRYIDDNVWRLGKVKASTEEVLEETGEHCERPYRCWYWDTCHKNEIIQ